MSQTTVTTQRLSELLKDPSAVALRARVRLQPACGPGTKVFPPTYAGGIYAFEDRLIDGKRVKCVLLDSIQSQANRMEELLQDAFLPGWNPLDPAAPPDTDIPLFAVYIENHGWITTLTAPHRIFDAIIRDTKLEGTKFRESAVGSAIVNARLNNATALFRYCPTCLVFGTWDSTAGEGPSAAKIPRAVVSEIIGVNVVPGVRTASRIDPLGIKKGAAKLYQLKDGGWTLTDQATGKYVGATEDEVVKTKDGKPKLVGKQGSPSEINHGNITPDIARYSRDEVTDSNLRLDRLPDPFGTISAQTNYKITDGSFEGTLILHSPSNIREGSPKPGGVTMEYGLHTWLLSLTHLRRIRFPVNGKDSVEQNIAGRAVLASLGLLALALEIEQGYWLRSGCHLLPESEPELEVVKLGSVERVQMPSAEQARQLFQEALSAAEDLGLPWERKTTVLEPIEQLKVLVQRSDQMKEAPEEEGEDAGVSS